MAPREEGHAGAAEGRGGGEEGVAEAVRAPFSRHGMAWHGAARRGGARRGMAKKRGGPVTSRGSHGGAASLSLGCRRSSRSVHRARRLRSPLRPLSFTSLSASTRHRRATSFPRADVSRARARERAFGKGGRGGKENEISKRAGHAEVSRFGARRRRSFVLAAEPSSVLERRDAIARDETRHGSLSRAFVILNLMRLPRRVFGGEEFCNIFS